MSDLIEYRGKALTIQNLLSDSANKELIEQGRFFLPCAPLVDRRGIVAMLIADSRPERRCCSYTEGDWLGIGAGQPCGFDKYDPMRQAHYVDTEAGVSLIRVFVLNKQIADIFDHDQYLGEPMIHKLACDDVFDDNTFDEIEALASFCPVSDAYPIIESVAKSCLVYAGIEPEYTNLKKIRSWISFHGWAYYPLAVAQAQQSLERALGNFDRFLQRATPTRTASSSNNVGKTCVVSSTEVKKLIP